MVECVRRGLRLRGAGLLACLLFALPAGASIRFPSRTDSSGGFFSAACLAVADFYGADGLPDVAVTFAGSDRIVFYRNNGGTFTRADILAAASPDVSIASNVGAKPVGIVAVDLDGDTVPDIAGANEQASHFFAYFNRPGGWVPTDATADRTNSALSVTAAQWSNPTDTAQDLVFGFDNGSVAIALGNVDGSGNPTGDFRDANRFSTSPSGSMLDVHVGDFDGASPTSDVLTLDATNKRLVVWRGDPVLPGAIALDATTTAITTSVPVTVSGSAATPIQAIVQDWDGDTLLDALVAVEEGYVIFYAGSHGAAPFVNPIVTDLVGGLTSRRMPTTITSIAYADLDGDNIPDLLVADAGDVSNALGFNWLTVFHGCQQVPRPIFDVDGGTCGVPPQHLPTSDQSSRRPGSVAVADFDGDGHADVLVLDGDSRAYWGSLFRNRGDGTLVGALAYAAGSTTPVSIAAGDLNNDGKQDAVVALAPTGQPTENTLSVLRGTASGGLTRATLQPALAAQTTPRQVVVGAFDAGSTADGLAAFGADSGFWPGAGDGTLRAPSTVTGLGGNLVRVGTFDGNAPPDLVAAESSQNRLTIWNGNGDGTFTRGPQVSSVWQPTDMVVAPFLGHGRDEIVVSCSTVQFGGNPNLLLIPYDPSAGAYVAPVPIPVPSPIGDNPGAPMPVLAAGDLDGNGSPDLVASDDQGDIVIWTGSPSGLSYRGDLSFLLQLGAGPVALALRDLDGDGKLDLVAALAASVVVYPGNGDGTFAPSITPPLLSNIGNAGMAIADLDGDGLPEILLVGGRTADVTVFHNESPKPFRLHVGRDATVHGGTLTWTDLGSGTTYDVVRGDVSIMEHVNRNTSDAACMVGGDNVTVTSFPDPTPVPAPAGAANWGSTNAFYYLVRCAGAACTEPDWGTDSAGNPHVLPLGCP